jgi:hypothetical protein
MPIARLCIDTHYWLSSWFLFAGDPIVTHDQFNDRWILMRFRASAPFALCLAVSQTEDAAGSYFLYSIDFGTTFPDYPVRT